MHRSFQIKKSGYYFSLLIIAVQAFIFIATPSTSLAAGGTSGSQLASLSFSQARIESGKSATGLVNGASSGTVTPVYGCYQATWLSASISPGSTSWSPGNFTFTNAGAAKVTESWNFWTHRVSGSFVDSQPTNCNYTSGVSPDISASIDVYPVGSLSPSTQTISGSAGTSITASSALSPNASWPETLVYSITPSLPSGLTLNTSTGSISGTPASAQSSTTYTITAKTTTNSVIVWDATATVSISVSSPTPPSAPTIDSVTAGDSQLLVAFTAGASGGATITDYKYSIDNGSNWTSAATTTSPITITGLTNGTTYNVKLRAVNSAGDGTASSASTGTPKGSQTVTWAPTNTSLITTASPVTPSSGATSNGNGAITYAVQSAGTTGCSVNSLTGQLAYTAAGSCVVRATAAGTTSYNSGYTDVTFVITDPNNSQNSGSGGSGSSGGPSVAPAASATPTPTPTQTKKPKSSKGNTSSTASPTPTSTATPTPIPTQSSQGVATPPVSEFSEFSAAKYVGSGLAKPSRGRVVAVVGDIPIDPIITTTSIDTKVDLGQRGSFVVFTQDSSGETKPLNSEAILQTDKNSKVRIEASGFAPNSPVEFWLFSTPVRLGSGFTNSAGDFSGEFEVPATVPFGRHTLQINSLSSEGKVTSIALALEKTENPSSVGIGNVANSWGSGLALGILVLVVLGVLLLTRRRGGRRAS